MKKTLTYIVSSVALISTSILLTCSSTTVTDEGQKKTAAVQPVYPISIPKALDFAGEQVPLDNFEVRERMERELLVNTYWHSQTFINIKKSARWFPVIEPILKKNGLPDDFKYLVVAESGLTNTISSAGATGFFQFTEATAKKYNLEINEDIDERYHVELSAEAACRFLQDSKKLFGSWTMAAASYNMGSEGLRQQVEKQKVNTYYDLLLSDETLRYLARIIAIKEVLMHPELYGYNLKSSDLYAPYKYSTVVVDSSLSNLAYFAISKGISYKTLKLLNPWLRSNTLPNKLHKKYTIKLLDANYTGVFPDAK